MWSRSKFGKASWKIDWRAKYDVGEGKVHGNGRSKKIA